MPDSSFGLIIDQMEEVEKETVSAREQDSHTKKVHIFDQYRGVIAADRKEQLIESAPYLRAYIERPVQGIDMATRVPPIPNSVLVQELTHLSYLKAHLELSGLKKAKGVTQT